MKKGLFIAFFALILPGALFSYGYGVQDPLIVGFKSLGQKLANQDWDGIAKEINSLKDQIRNAESVEGTPFSKAFAQSIQEKDRKSLSTTWVQLTLATIRIHLWWNLHENISNPTHAKSRIDSLNRYLKDILGPHIKTNQPELYKEISSITGQLHETIGNPGVFGLGAVARDESRFFDLVNQFEKSIWKAFPNTQPKWFQTLNKENSLKRAEASLKKLRNSKSFPSMKNHLDESRIAFSFNSQEKWKTYIQKLYIQMGTPPEGSREGQPPTAKFQITLTELINQLTEKK